MANTAFPITAIIPMAICNKASADYKANNLLPTTELNSSTTNHFSCPLCDYQTQSLWHLRRHIQFHQEKSTHQCASCSYSVNKSSQLAQHTKYHHLGQKRSSIIGVLKDTSSNDQMMEVGETSVDTKEQKPEWYYPINGPRRRFVYCRDCLFKSLKYKELVNHVFRHHPNSSTALPPPRGTLRSVQVYQKSSVASKTEKTEILSLACAHCSFRTADHRSFVIHESLHRNEAASLKCNRCSYSVSNLQNLTNHLKYHHLDEKPFVDREQEEIPSSPECLVTYEREERSGRQTFKEVALNTSYFSQSKIMGRTQINSTVKLKKNRPAGTIPMKPRKLFSSKFRKNTAEIHVVRNGVQSIKEKIRIGNEKLREIGSKKEELAIRIKEIAGKGMSAELALRTTLAAARLKSEKEKTNQTSVNETRIIHHLEGQVRLCTNHLRLLGEEQLILARDMEKAEEYLTLTRSFLRFLEAELEELRSK